VPEILIAIPVLNRPHRAQAVYDSAKRATDVPHEILFLVSEGDRKQLHACQATGASVWVVPWAAGRGDYARKINAALKWPGDARWIFCGADDLEFQDGWASAAIAVGYIDEVGVVGTNDGVNPRVKRGVHSTHSLVSREYAIECGTIDETSKILHEGYDHQFVDDELVGTAKSRGCWSFAPNARVEHLHPFFGTAELDETYTKAQRATRSDQSLFHHRRRLWGGR
jgi:glycosyltransferase involved in cell wall biosynthesis